MTTMTAFQHGQHPIKKSSVSFILAFCTPCGVSRVLRKRPSPLACAVGHAVTFVENVALMASRWQNRAWTVSPHPPITHRARGWTNSKSCFSSLQYKPTRNRTQTDFLQFWYFIWKT